MPRSARSPTAASKSEQDYAAAIVAGDRAKIEESRRDALDAWRAERRARGDGEAEINAGARTLDAQYRKAALRHRFAQMDGTGIQRALDEDEDATADPAAAREIADNILRIRHEDPARVAEASIEREIAAKKRDGRTDTPEEETRERDSVGAEFGVEQPLSPLRELRKLIGRIRSVAAFKDGGTPLMSDDDVGGYIAEARNYVRPDYRDIFEITVLAVRAGMIPWWRAQEQLREYFAPESTGEAILDGILDFIPIVGQVKGTIEIGEALDGLRIALDEGDEAGAVKFAADAALLLAGLIPILKAGKFAKHIPGLEKLKDILGEFAGGRLEAPRSSAPYPKSFTAEIPWIAGEDGSLTLRYDEDADRFFPATWDDVFSLGFERDEIEDALREATDLGWRFTVEPSFPVFAKARTP